jgi:benzylsuccinate CoA-transferase BbsE subunit
LESISRPRSKPLVKEMGEKTENDTLLPRLRVLDLTDEKGFLCGKILADLGADVIKIERPGGDPSRNIGPFYHDIPDPEKSLFWFAYNNNKRGITLDMEKSDGREIFKRLVKAADILIESFSPGYMASLDLGYPALSEINPGLVMVSITPFGQTGPYKDYEGPDIVCMAMSGFMYLCGDADKPPVRIPIPQAYLAGGADGAVGALLAYYYRQTHGKGQYVDVSMQESLLSTMALAIPLWQVERSRLRRYGNSRRLGSGGLSRIVWRCKDSHVNFVIHGGQTGSRTNRALAAWMDKEGMLPDFMREIDWDKLDLVTVPKELMSLLEEHISKFFISRTKADLYQWALQHQAMLYPVSTSKDLMENIQLSDRNFWIEVEHPELGDTITYPGPWAMLSRANLTIGRRPPLIGEHNQDVYQRELHIPYEEIVILKQAGVI